MSGIVLAENATCGEEAVIQWNGISQSVKVFLVDENEERYEAQIKVITASGMIFIVPLNISPGNYRVILVQNEEVEAGTITVHETDMPITGIDFPGAAAQGSEFELGGVGFNDSYDVILKSADGQIILESTVSMAGLKCTIPEGLPSGKYTLVLTNGTSEWVLSTSFLVSKIKTLVAVIKDEPYEDNVRYCSEYRVYYNDSVVSEVTFSQYLMEDSQVVEVNIQDSYTQVSDGYYAADGGHSSSNNIDFKYVKDSYGRILSADVLRYSSKDPNGVHRVFTWVYDSVGMPTDVQFELNGSIYSIQDYIYDNGNLLETQACVFVYEDETLIPNPFGPDAAHGFDMMHNLMEPFLYVQYLIGEHPFSSRLLPSGYMAISGSTSRVMKPFTYVFDEDGYVTEMSWSGDANALCYIRYEYR